jgi:hypothetical protein
MAAEVRRAREHFGKGRLAIDSAKAVFINCPFDSDFEPFLDAIVFACVCCGLTPRSALETGTTSTPRVDRIVQALFTSKYSIHDLSRCKGEGSEQLARFNMPLELGMAMTLRFMPTKRKLSHDWLALVPAGHAYLRFVSDLRAYDLVTYDGTVQDLVPKVMAWLATRHDVASMLYPDEVLEKLVKFQAAKAELKQKWRGDVPWADLVIAAVEIAALVADRSV